MKSIPVVLGLLLLSAPLAAQRTGSVNRTAPEVSQAIEFTNEESISLSYQAITWAQGKTMEAAMNKEEGGRTRQYINQMAKQSPLGSFQTSVDVTIGSTKIAAGEYKLYFTIGDDLKWSANFASGDDVISMALDLKDNQMEHKRLLISLHAGEKPTDAGMYIAFGKSYAMYDVKSATAEKKGD